ncbi:MAG TPA: SRPBCC domain-containing protein [Myxococcota bacterium]|nr:SRPBCC domain-containing protein [Myxococcota bacterium]
MTRSDEVVRASTVVAAAPDDAFRLFTDEVDAWWRRGPRFRFRPGADGVMRFEGEAGGRLVEAFDAAGEDVYEVGRILAWEPPGRLCFEFRARAFAPGETTRVEIRFEAVAQGTRVVVEHAGFEAFAADHPVRHGLVGPAFGAMMGSWWADLLLAARRRAAERSAA